MDSIYSHFYLILCGSISFVTFPIFVRPRACLVLLSVINKLTTDI